MQPRKTRYKKLQKGKIKKYNFRSTQLTFGIIGLKAISSGIISSRQLESARQTINRKLKRKGKIWIKIFPSIPVTEKPVSVRMGKGKGVVKYWGCKVSSGKVLFELCGVSIKESILALKSGSNKLPIKTKIIY
jgi:large subunit ribosomal protein L16